MAFRMITALRKRLGGGAQAVSGSGDHAAPGQHGLSSGTNHRIPTGVNLMSADLQKRFAHGVHYNMKIVIRGDRNSGKTCLWHRIQGRPFHAAYDATDEIQAANVRWSYRSSDHIVKLDVWDVVDESQKRRVKMSGLKLDNVTTPTAETPPETAACDAKFIDVYKNCNGVLLVFDITKPWTWQYVQQELPKIPPSIPVLVLGNKQDLEAERQVSEEEVVAFIDGFSRQPAQGHHLSAKVRYTPASMKNALGLKFLYKFLNVPFLFLQRQTLESMLAANLNDISSAYSELDRLGGNAEGNFDSPVHGAPSLAGNNAVTAVEALVGSEEDTRSPVRNSRTRTESSSSEGQNRMVDTFEEDFDSGEEIEVYAKKSNNCQSQTVVDSKRPKSQSAAPPPPPPPARISVQVPSRSVDTEDGSEEATTPRAPVPPPLKNENENEQTGVGLNAWLDTPSHPASLVTSPTNLSPNEDSEDESEVKSNPLVTPIPDDDEDDSADDDKASSAMISTHGSSAGSQVGLTMGASPVASSATSEATSSVDGTRHTNRSRAGRKQPKKKKDDGEKGKKKEKEKEKKSKKRQGKKEPNSDLLVEDAPTSPVIDAAQYETL